MTTPQHGQERNHHLHSEWDGSMGYDETRSEKFCAHCKAWVTVHGVIGALAWTATHRNGDCMEELTA